MYIVSHLLGKMAFIGHYYCGFAMVTNVNSQFLGSFCLYRWELTHKLPTCVGIGLLNFCLYWLLFLKLCVSHQKWRFPPVFAGFYVVFTTFEQFPTCICFGSRYFRTIFLLLNDDSPFSTEVPSFQSLVGFF